MSDTLKCLGQSAPNASTATTLYTVPASTSTVVSSIFVCNQNTADVRVRVWIAVAGAGDAAKQYLYYDVVLQGAQTIVLVAGITLAATDLLRIQSDTANVSFNAFGTEVT